MRKLSLALSCLLALSALSAFGQSGSFQLQKNEAFVIVNNLPLYQEVKSGVLKWKESLVIGDKVALTGKTWKFKVDGNEREYARVKSPAGTEGWVRSSYAIPKCQLAAVKADPATIYGEPREVKMTSKSVSCMTVVAALVDGSTADFAKIVCYDPTADSYFSDPVFVKKEDLSYDEVDLNALILFMTAKGSKDKALRAKFLANIDKNYQTTVFYEKIRAALSPDASAARQTAPFSGKFTANDDKVNVRSQPDEANGQVLGQLEKGAAVEAVEATTQSYTVGGRTAPWYRIKSPEGWVFGSFLTQD
jgi:hypothetical protein